MDTNVDALLVAFHKEGDERARDQALVELMPLVRALASRYAGRGEPFEDLVQVGSIGLIKAVDRFDVDRGVDFASYAVPTIVGEIRRHFRDKAWAMHVPRRLKELSLRLSRVLDQLTTELGRSPTIAELAAAAGVEEEEAIDALDSMNAYSTRSLHAPFDDGSDDSLAEKLSSLIQRQSAWLLEQAWRESDFPDVVHQAAEVCHLLDFELQSHPFGDVTRVDRHRSRVTGRVPVPCVERRDERAGELEVRTLERLVDLGQITSQLALLAIQRVETLRPHGRNKKQY